MMEEEWEKNSNLSLGNKKKNRKVLFLTISKDQDYQQQW